MLLHQAVKGFELWFGQHPRSPKSGTLMSEGIPESDGVSNERSGSGRSLSLPNHDVLMPLDQRLQIVEARLHDP